MVGRYAGNLSPPSYDACQEIAKDGVKYKYDIKEVLLALLDALRPGWIGLKLRRGRRAEDPREADRPDLDEQLGRVGRHVGLKGDPDSWSLGREALFVSCHLGQVCAWRAQVFA